MIFIISYDERNEPDKEPDKIFLEKSCKRSDFAKMSGILQNETP